MPTNNKKIKIKKYYQNDNGKYSITKIMEGTLTETMVPAMYSIKYDGMRERFYAEKISDNVKLPDKVFDTGHDEITQRIIHNYLEKDKATGCVFHGPAGVGKSITSQILQNIFISELNKPVYIVSEPFVGQDFMDFINDLGDGLFVFDEFEKQYSIEAQNKLLPLFDGADSKTKRLSIVIVNNYYNLSNFYKNRVGRSRYTIEWTTLPVSFIKDYLDSELESKEFIQDIVTWVENAPLVTFDNLEAVVTECNRYPKNTFEENIKYLNIAGKTLYSYYKVLKVIGYDNKSKEEYVLSSKDHKKYVKGTSYIEIDLQIKDGKGGFSIQTEDFSISDAMYHLDDTIVIDNSFFYLYLKEITKEEYEQYEKEQ